MLDVDTFNWTRTQEKRCDYFNTYAYSPECNSPRTSATLLTRKFENDPPTYSVAFVDARAGDDGVSISKVYNREALEQETGALPKELPVDGDFFGPLTREQANALHAIGKELAMKRYVNDQMAMAKLTLSGALKNGPT